MRIRIEATRGTYRVKNGVYTGLQYAADYGEIVGTRGADGDPVDVYRGLFPDTETVFVVNQFKDGRFDEHKVMIDFYDRQQAMEAYRISTGVKPATLFSHTKTNIVPCTRAQLEWWLEHGNHFLPVTLKSFPHDAELSTMDDIIDWTNENQTAAQLVYQWRKTDTGEELLEGAVMDELLAGEAADGAEIEHDEAVFDALVVQNKKIERTANLLGQAFNRASGSLKVAENGIHISKPMKRNGTTNVAMIFEMTDGQTVTVFLHNPDTTPNKLAADDMLISWKWLLNRKDITIVVAKENGRDLAIQLVARRVMALVEKNTARFAKANATRADRLANIARLEGIIAEKETEFEGLLARLNATEAAQVPESGGGHESVPGQADDAPQDAGGGQGGQGDAGELDISAIDTDLNAYRANGESAFEAARNFFREKLQGRFVNTVIGKVHLLGSTWGKMKSGAHKDDIQSALIPFVPAILKTGTYEGRADPKKSPTNQAYVAFHSFLKGGIEIGSHMVEARIFVGERDDGQYEYVAYSLHHDNGRVMDATNPNYNPRFAGASLGFIAGIAALDGTVRQYSDGVNGVFDSIADGKEGWNIEIVSIRDLDGNEIPNEADDADAESLGLHERYIKDLSRLREDFASQYCKNPTRGEMLVRLAAEGDLIESYLFQANGGKPADREGNAYKTGFHAGEKGFILPSSASKYKDGGVSYFAVRLGAAEGLQKLVKEKMEYEERQAKWAAEEAKREREEDERKAAEQAAYNAHFTPEQQKLIEDAEDLRLNEISKAKARLIKEKNNRDNGKPGMDDDAFDALRFKIRALRYLDYDVIEDAVGGDADAMRVIERNAPSVAAFLHENVKGQEGEPVVLTGNELGVFDLTTEEGQEQLRQAAFDEMKRIAKSGETVHCPALKAEIHFSVAGANKFKRFSGDLRKIKMAAQIKQIIAAGRKFKESQESYAEGEIQGHTVYHYLKTPVKLDGTRYGARVVIREDNMGNYYWDLRVAGSIEAIFDDAKKPTDVSTSLHKGDRPTSVGEAAIKTAYENNTAVFDDSSSGFVLNLFLFDENGNEIPDEGQDESGGSGESDSVADRLARDIANLGFNAAYNFESDHIRENWHPLIDGLGLNSLGGVGHYLTQESSNIYKRADLLNETSKAVGLAKNRREIELIRQKFDELAVFLAHNDALFNKKNLYQGRY